MYMSAGKELESDIERAVKTGYFRRREKLLHITALLIQRPGGTFTGLTWGSKELYEGTQKSTRRCFSSCANVNTTLPQANVGVLLSTHSQCLRGRSSLSTVLPVQHVGNAP